MLNRLTLVPLFALLLGSGCASVFHGRHQTLTIDSDPAGAAATVECAGTEPQRVTTPAKVELRRGPDSCRVTFTREGYETTMIPLTRHISGLFWTNFVPGVVIGAAAGTGSAYAEISCDNPDGCGNDSNSDSLVALAVGTGVSMLVDKATGAMWSYEPAKVHAVMKSVR